MMRSEPERPAGVVGKGSESALSIGRDPRQADMERFWKPDAFRLESG